MKQFDLKSLFAGLIIGTIGVTTVFAATGIKSATFSNSKVHFNGQEIPLKNQLVAVVKEGSKDAQLYMPMRELLEYMQFNVEWNSKDSSVNLTVKEFSGFNNDTAYKTYTPEEADKKGIEMMDNSGTWGQEIESLFPYMTPAGVEKVVSIYLERHLFPGITTPQAAKQVASTIDTALKYMTKEAKKTAEDKISAYY